MRTKLERLSVRIVEDSLLLDFSFGWVIVEIVIYASIPILRDRRKFHIIHWILRIKIAGVDRIILILVRVKTNSSKFLLSNFRTHWFDNKLILLNFFTFLTIAIVSWSKGRYLRRCRESGYRKLTVVYITVNVWRSVIDGGYIFLQGHICLLVHLIQFASNPFYVLAFL